MASRMRKIFLQFLSKFLEVFDDLRNFQSAFFVVLLTKINKNPKFGIQVPDPSLEQIKFWLGGP